MTSKRFKLSKDRAWKPDIFKASDEQLQQRYKEAQSIAKQFMEPLHHIIQEPLPGSSMVARHKNVYVSLSGFYCPTPFEMPREGLWYFDGQVFYQPRRHL